LKLLKLNTESSSGIYACGDTSVGGTGNWSTSHVSLKQEVTNGIFVHKLWNGSNGSDYEWTHVGGKWHHHPKGHPPPTDMDKIWCPTTKDECLQIGIVLGAAGAVAAGVYVVFQAVRGAIR
jgi:hypothetical protein